MQHHNKAIIKTLLYSNLFDYPLTVHELWRFALLEKPCQEKSIISSLTAMATNISHNGAYYALKKRESIVSLRQKREKIWGKKIAKTKKIVEILSHIPTLLFIGISGSVAMKNAEEQDDIDLFFITQKNTVWISRFFVVMTLTFLGVRRKKHESDVTDRFCANMFLDTCALAFPNKRQTMYVAHEIAQLKPLFSIGRTYHEFIAKNLWITKILPNWSEEAISPSPNTLLRSILTAVCQVLERTAYVLQQWYMKKSITNEIITPFVIAFHPNNTGNRIEEMFRKVCQQYGV